MITRELRDAGSCFPQSSDSQHCARIEPRSSVCLPARMYAALSVFSIAGILQCRAQIEMVDVNARRIVAFMEHAHAWRNRSALEGKC